MSYKDLEIWQLARQQSIEIHKMTMTLPKFELYEAGQQIRRSIKSVRSNIVEGYGRKHYPRETFRFTVFSLASNDETTDHLEMLFETGSLSDQELYERLHRNQIKLGVKLNNYCKRLLRDLHKK